MELTELVRKWEIGHHDHETRIIRLEKENEKQTEAEKNFHDYIVATEAKAEGRDKVLKTMLSILTAISIVSPAITILINSTIK